MEHELRAEFWHGMCEGKKHSIAKNPDVEIFYDYILEGLSAEWTKEVGVVPPPPVVGAPIVVVASPPQEDANWVSSEAGK